MGHALAAQAETLSGIGAGRDRQDERLFQGGDADFATGNGGKNINRHIHVQVIASALEGFIGQDVHDQIQVSSRRLVLARLAFACQADA